MLGSRTWQRWLAAAAFALPLATPTGSDAQELVPASKEWRSVRRQAPQAAMPELELPAPPSPRVAPAPPERHALAPGIEIVGANVAGVGQVRPLPRPAPEPAIVVEAPRGVTILSSSAPASTNAPEPTLVVLTPRIVPIASNATAEPPTTAWERRAPQGSPAPSAPSGIVTASFTVAPAAPTPTVVSTRLPALAPAAPDRKSTAAESPAPEATAAVTPPAPMAVQSDLEKHSYYLFLAAGANFLAQVFGGLFLMSRRSRRRERERSVVAG